MLIIVHVLLVLELGGCTADPNVETKTVAVGQDVTLICDHRTTRQHTYLYWIRLVSGTFPEVLGGTGAYDLEDYVETRHLIAKQEPGKFVLHILGAQLSDTAVYYCIKASWFTMTFSKGTFLRIKEPEPDVTAITQHSLSDPVRPGVSMTLQCSVLSDSDDETCPGGHSVCCLKDGSDVDPSFNHIQENPEELSTKKCIYGFFSNVSSSEAATCRCAVFGNGTKPDTEAVNMRANTIVFLLCAALALSLIVIAVLIYSRDICKGVQNPAGQHYQNLSNLRVYSAAVFTVMKKDSGGTGDAAEREKIYAAVKVLGLN